VPSRTLRIDRPLDLGLTLGPLRHGAGDPTIAIARGHVLRATRTPDGPATIELRITDDRLDAEAWGPGADRALAAVPDLVGWHDDPSAMAPGDPFVARLARRLAGLRLGRSGAVMESLVPAIIEQKVTGREAFRAFRGLVRRYGEPAPGPLGLMLPPEPETLARLPYYAFHPLGVERRRADTIRRAAGRAAWLEEVVALPLPEAYARLRSIPGVGVWTAAEVAVRALGDVDAVSVGDFHLPKLVAWALAGEPRATDERMLELLEPYRGQRARVVRLIEAGGLGPPRRAPRLPARSIAEI
jgi:3-methyladenine DNA glycosylase/8-oxoguanine DNA glycosylase